MDPCSVGLLASTLSKINLWKMLTLFLIAITSDGIMTSESQLISDIKIKIIFKWQQKYWFADIYFHLDCWYIYI